MSTTCTGTSEGNLPRKTELFRDPGGFSVRLKQTGFKDLATITTLFVAAVGGAELSEWTPA
jgi:hypothetical protein